MALYNMAALEVIFRYNNHEVTSFIELDEVPEEFLERFKQRKRIRPVEELSFLISNEVNVKMEKDSIIRNLIRQLVEKINR
jgi:hypothetical protein